MQREEIQKLVLEGLEMCNHARPDESQIPLESGIELFGENGYLDSMGLVSLLLDIEDALLDAGHEVALSDDKAMSQKNSPFRSVDTLTDYIQNCIQGN
ncbi:MAG: acyl carrier protein [Pseudomonadota bacterium]